MPREHYRIMVRPRGGLTVKNVSHTKVAQALFLGPKPKNPRALEVKCMKNTTKAAVLFDDLNVPNYVMCGRSIRRCTLCRRQTDICPTPEKTICTGCGIASPPEDHVCTQECALCGALIPRRTSSVSSGFNCRTLFAEEEGSASEPSHLCRKTENATRAGHLRGYAPRRHVLAPKADAPVPRNVRDTEEVRAPRGHQPCASRSHPRLGRPRGSTESRDLHQR
ncbi:hypothetical protein HPB48_021591 [Haemaphysalis longicornis]|uniref:Uncharacterized protein n=1 Tax=Haemaphysalis longicornis TaxID=44386 RepID=A0A9J6GN84_HAELO|nr:hypothetical protein HPB48_021591 [Haemaphysalis longicornis]